jgi:hypothetical protein
VSDSAARMINAALVSLKASPLPDVDCKVLDSQDLASEPNNYFTQSIKNFSIFAFINPTAVIRETYRTISPGGVAFVTCWRRFAPMFIVHAAQNKIRPDLPLMPTPSPQFYEEGVLQKVVEEGGFAKDNITVVVHVLVIDDDENIAGLTMLMPGPMMGKARDGYTEEEQAKWTEAISQSVKEEVAQFGGYQVRGLRPLGY